LHADIQTYLHSFEFESPYAEPVTLAHLLTHTSGIVDPPYMGNTDPAAVQPLAEFLEANLPSPTHPPGEVNSYSNYGYALAGLIVEETSGVSFDEYVRTNIFQPLQMSRSSYLITPQLTTEMTTGYLYQDGQQIPQPREYDSDYPGGSIISTAEDMSHFLVAHLQEGCYEGECILSFDTIAAMHTKQAQTSYEGQNMTYGFVEGFDDGVRLIGHSGAARGYGSSLNIFPDYDMGYFFCFNAWCYETSACQIIPEFRQAFVERFMLAE
jgi:CubicO group peptidase (beta-lactamase class C family)